MLISENRDHVHISINSLTLTLSPNFTLWLCLSDHYFIIIYRSFKKFGTCDHKIWGYKLTYILL